MKAPPDSSRDNGKPLAEVLQSVRQWQDRARSRSRELVGSLLATPDLQGVVRQVLDPQVIEDWPTRRIYRAILQTEPLTSTAVAAQLEAERSADRPATGWGDELRRLEDAAAFLTEKGMRNLVADVVRLNNNARFERETHEAVLTLHAHTEPEVPAEIESRLVSRASAREMNRIQVSRPSPLDLEAIARDGLPAIPWLIPGWLTEDDIALLAGGPYSGKTTFVYDLVQSLTTKRQCCGLKPTKAIRVLVVDEEMGRRASSRLMIRLGGHNPNLRLFSMGGFHLGTPEGIAKVEMEVADFKPGLIVGDSLTHLLQGIGDENDPLLMATIFRALFRLRDNYGAAFLGIDHRPKWGRLGRPGPSELLDLIVRGSGVKATQATTVWAMIRNDNDSADLLQAKRRESKLLSLRIGYEEDGEEGAITLSGLGAPDEALSESMKAQLWVYDYIVRQGLACRAELLRDGEAAGHPVRTLERALTDLKRSERIERPRRGSYRPTLGGKPGRILAEAGGEFFQPEDPTAWGSVSS